MRLSILLVVIVSVGFIYMACSKRKIQSPLARQEKLLRGWTYSVSPELQTRLTFDAKGALKEERGNEISSYYFNGDSVIVREFDKEEDRYVYEFAGKLDSNRKLMSGIAISSYVTSAPDTVRHSFRYNVEGYLLSEKRISSSADTFLVKYEYRQDKVSRIRTYTNSELYNTKELVYYQNEISCSLPEEFKFRKNLNNLVGRSGRHPIKEIISTGKGGKQKYVLNYTYEMDESGYVSKMVGRKGKKIKEVVTFMYDPADVSKSSLASIK